MSVGKCIVAGTYKYSRQMKLVSSRQTNIQSVTMSSRKKRVCIIGAGPCGMCALYHFAKESGSDLEFVCYEKQSTWGGLWNYTWRTGTDEFGEACHGGMYRHLWSNAPKECSEFPDYTYEEHFGKAIPSYAPRAVIRDYHEGRMKKVDVDLKKFVQFNTVVQNVQYVDARDNFIVTINSLDSNSSHFETFTHVIVAVGIFNVPNMPSFPGIETFEGRILHAHNFRDASQFKGQRLLLIGSHYSAEDIALQCLKFGAKNVVCTWRTKPMGFKWPKQISERPLVKQFGRNTAYFKDGTSEKFDCIILCTGYLYRFPFMEDRLRLRSERSFYPDNLYKGVVWMLDGNNKVFYLGTQDQYFSFTMFDVQALWTCKYIRGTLPNEPKKRSCMREYVEKWVTRLASLNDCHDDVDFQADYVADLSKDTGYPADAIKARELYHKWLKQKDENITTYRDQTHASIYTGTMSPKLSTAWWEEFDDSIKTFTSV